MTDDMWTAEFWDERYSSSERIWSGAPNPHLVDVVGGLVPGSAVDIGCGEGADVLWLAHRGWRATGVDLSQVALDRGAARAAQEGVEATWLQADLLAETLPEQYDLVSAHFVHVPTQLFAPLYTRLGAAVAPGGSLLVVGHHPHDVETGVRHHHGDDILFTPDRVVGLLDPQHWDVRRADAPTRTQRVEDADVAVTDTVVHAVRR